MKYDELLQAEADIRNVRLPHYSFEIVEPEASLYEDIRRTAIGRYYDEVAAKHNLTIFQAPEYPVGTKEQAATGKERFDWAQGFLAKYGIPLRTLNRAGTPFSEAELGENQTDSLLRNLVRTYNGLPLEFANQTGIDEINITETGEPSSIQFSDTKEADGTYKTILSFNAKSGQETIQDEQGPPAIMGELYRGWDVNTGCGSLDNSERDPGFAKVNGPDKRQAGISLEELAVIDYTLSGEHYEALQNNDRQAACNIQQTYADALKNTTSINERTKHGSNADEKAALAGALVDSEKFSQYGDPGKGISAGFAELYARLDPNQQEYFADTRESGGYASKMYRRLPGC